MSNRLKRKDFAAIKITKREQRMNKALDRIYNRKVSEISRDRAVQYATSAFIMAMQELQQYKQLGTLEEVREAVETIKRYETQYPDDMRNPLEPLKVSSALKSEIMKLEFRKQSKPESISILDYTIIAALQKVLEEVCGDEV